MRRLEIIAVFAVLVASKSNIAQGQVAYPEHMVQNVIWSSGVHNVAVSNRILAPGTPNAPVVISGAAEAEFVSGTEVHLTAGFHAGGFAGNGSFHARIDPLNGGPDDVVAIAPDPSSSVTDNVLHVPKWEKVEIGVRLPQGYQDAIDRFFAHYYSNGVDTSATPDQVDHDHDMNPYADDTLQLVMMLTDPSGDTRMKWGFFMKEGTWTSTADNGLLTEDLQDSLHPYSVRCRIAPDEEGPWSFELKFSAPYTSSLSNAPMNDLHFNGYDFVCDAPPSDSHGSLHVNPVNRRTLQFEDSTSFFAMGLNMADIRCAMPSGGVGYAFHHRDQEWFLRSMDLLHEAGGNYMRMFLMPRIFAPEYVNLGVYDSYWTDDPCVQNSTTPDMKGNCQFQCWAFDRIMDKAAETDIYLQVALDPYPPIIAYQNLGWGSHPMFTQFVRPHVQTPPSNKYDLKRFFYADGDTTNAAPGDVLYYWKRKYKYMMARWGYSTNLAILEPFNEIDQMLSYSTRTTNDNCNEDDGLWQADAVLPPVINKWVTDMAHYVRDDVDTSASDTSPLGEDKKLFLMSYTDPWPPPSDPAQYFLPFSNPNVDIIDVHKGLGDTPDALVVSYTEGRNYRDSYLKPFNRGEHTYYGAKDYVNQSNDTVSFETAKIFSNYDVSFHNELWASAFFGNMSTGNSWLWQRVFWWPDALPQMSGPDRIPRDVGNGYQEFHTGVLGATNILRVGPGIYDTVRVKNRTVYHNFKPLSDMLYNADWQAYDFFSFDYTAHKLYDNANKLECYYLQNADSNLAIGWVHNLNGYWDNHNYLTKTVQNFFGCSAPNSQQLTLPAFAEGLPYHITWFPTRMNDTIHPVDAVDSTGSGYVLLDFSLAPLGDTANKYLDTLQMDYGFIISLAPVLRNMNFDMDADTPPSTGWDFSLYPNPARDRLSAVFPDQVARDITIYDLSGRLVYQRNRAQGPVVTIPIDRFSSGTYCIRVSGGDDAKHKLFIVQ